LIYHRVEFSNLVTALNFEKLFYDLFFSLSWLRNIFHDLIFSYLNTLFRKHFLIFTFEIFFSILIILFYLNPHFSFSLPLKYVHFFFFKLNFQFLYFPPHKKSIVFFFSSWSLFSLHILMYYFLDSKFVLF
jgi:hypothetical protein